MYTILLVVESETLAAWQTVLESESYRVIGVHNHVEALARLRSSTVSLVDAS